MSIINSLVLQASVSVTANHFLIFARFTFKRIYRDWQRINIAIEITTEAFTTIQMVLIIVFYSFSSYAMCLSLLLSFTLV
jgi:hypothetical protein